MRKNIKAYIFVVVFCICFLSFSGCKKKDITITLYPNNGSETQVITATVNEKIPLPEIPTAEGYFFVGWFLDKDFKQKVGFPASFKNDVTLYGGWQTLVNYELNESTDTYEVTGVVFSHYNITVLETYHGKKVTSIKAEAFKDNDTIMNIKLPETITSIGDRAFMNMRYLMNINLPDSLTSIGDDIFLDSNMIYYEDLNGLKYINNWLIKAENARTDMVEMKETTKGIFPGAFKNNQNIKQITIPKSVTEILPETFKNSSITVLNIHDAVTYIDTSALIGTDKLMEINVDGANTVYESLRGVLYSKGLETLIKYPSSRENVEITLPNIVKEIYDYAFDNCVNLEKITILDNVIKIGKFAFNGCEKLNTVALSLSLQTLEEGAFNNCKALRSLVIPVGCVVGKNALSGCEELKSLTIPYIFSADSLYNAEYLFGASTNKVEELNILGGTKLPSHSLKGFNKVVTLVLPSTIVDIETSAFDGLDNLSNLSFESNSVYKMLDNSLLTSDGKKLLYYVPNNYTLHYVVPDSVEEISSYAFNNNSVLCVIDVTENVKTIRTHAFSNLLNITRIVFNGTLEVVEEDICINTPYVCMYFKNASTTEKWSEGYNTYGYSVKFNIENPQFIFADAASVEVKENKEVTIKYYCYNLDETNFTIKVYDLSENEVTDDIDIQITNQKIVLSSSDPGAYKLVIKNVENPDIVTIVNIRIVK